MGQDIRSQLVDQIEEEITKRVQVAAKAAASRFFPLYKKEVEEIFKKAVDEFYNSYTPDIYDRRYSLYDVLEIQFKPPLTLVGYFKPEVMTSTGGGRGYSGEDGIFKKVFEEGFHGGAHPGIGYRTPVYIWNTWSDRKVVKSASPYKKFMSYYNEAMEGSLQELWRKVAMEEISKVL